MQLKWTPTILSFQDWFIDAVLELAVISPSSHKQSSTSDTLMTLPELLHSTSRAGYDAQDHILHLLFNLVLCHYDSYLWDSFPVLPAPTKRLLRSHWLNSVQLFDDKTCTSALEMFMGVSNVFLLTQAIKHCSAPPAHCPSSPHPDCCRCPSPTCPQQPTRDASCTTQNKLHPFPFSFRKKEGTVDLSTSIDLYLHILLSRCRPSRPY